MIKICSVVGARPQLVKEAVIQKELRKYSEISHVLIHTGQHYDFNMSGVFFETMKMKQPDYFLGVSGVNALEAIALMIIKLEKVFTKEKPDVCIVYGDTNSTLAAAIVANKMSIKLAHIEAGLRQEPKSMPEESNRVITDHLSDYLFTPTKVAFDNLINERPKGKILDYGDVMFDLFLDNYEQIKLTDTSSITNSKDYILMTLHRDFNVDNKSVLETISKEVRKITIKEKVIFPIHPRTKKMLNQFGLLHYYDSVQMIEPINYFELMKLVMDSKLIITDSGGLQKEAYFCGKTALVLMPDSSWRELIDDNHHRLVKADNLLSAVEQITPLDNKPYYYGEGNAAKKIISFICEEFIT